MKSGEKVKDYQYPLDLDWSTEEMVIVMKMWDILEQAYENGVATSLFLETYRLFKSVVKSIGEERHLGNDFEKISGYSLYRTVQTAKKMPAKKILHMK